MPRPSHGEGHRTTRTVANTSTYVARKNGRATSVLLFCADKNKVHVLNESIEIDEEGIDRFVHSIFTALPSVTAISLSTQFEKNCIGLHTVISDALCWKTPS